MHELKLVSINTLTCLIESIPIIGDFSLTLNFALKINGAFILPIKHIHSYFI